MTTVGGRNYNRVLTSQHLMREAPYMGEVDSAATITAPAPLGAVGGVQ